MSIIKEEFKESQMIWALGDSKSFISIMESLSPEYLCSSCFSNKTFLYKASDIKNEDYFYMHTGKYCYSCLFGLEQNFIKELPLVKLPLFVNHEWVTPQGNRYYKEILKEVVL